MLICLHCALTGVLVPLTTVTVHEGPGTPASLDWHCHTCRRTGHHPPLS